MEGKLPFHTIVMLSPTEAHTQAHVPAALSTLDIVCLSISIVDHQAGAIFYPTAEPLALELATRISALRYVSLRIGASAGDSEWAGRVAWWRTTSAGGLRKLRRVTTGLGTCVEAYLTSAEFEADQRLDGAYQSLLSIYLCSSSLLVDPRLFPDEDL